MMMMMMMMMVVVVVVAMVKSCMKRNSWTQTTSEVSAATLSICDRQGT